MVDSTVADSASGATGRRRRYLTILFADLSDSTHLAETLEAEHYADALNAVRQACRHIVPKHGGRIAQLLGDGAVAIFGYPEPHEDDGRKATEAALELHAAVQSYRVASHDPGRATTLNLHTGIHSGLVLLGEGDVELGRFELLGTVPNIAARLADAAQRDEVLVSAETLGPESYFFETSELRFLSFKGINAPIAVYRVHGRAMIQTRFQASTHRGLAPFIGRHAETQLLDLHLREVLNGKSRSLAISASAGLGKSRLAEEFLRRSGELSCQIHRGYCDSDLSAEPLQPFLQMLRTLFAIEHDTSIAQATAKVAGALAALDTELIAHQPELLRLLSLSQDSNRPDATRTAGALVALFTSLASRQPQLIYIDDFQWADDATRQVSRAIRDLPDRAILTLMATRETLSRDAELRGAQLITLAPFTKIEAAETIARFLPSTDPFVTEEIYKYSGGNPLYIEELCHCAAHGDAQGRLPSHKGAAWLNTLVESRVARLPQNQAEVVRVAAVIGNVVPAWLLENITGYAEDHAIVRGLAERDFVFPGERAGTLRFKHGITRDVVYEAVGLHQREALHLQIADALQQRSGAAVEDAPEVLAYHFAAGGRATEAAKYAELAGDKALATSALDRAKTQYRAALTALDKLPPSTDIYRRWISIAQRLGLACVFDASRDELAVFRRAHELASAGGDLPTIARAQYWLGYIAYALGDSRASLQHCEGALLAARRIGDDPLIVQIRATLGQARAAASDYDLALELLDEAIAVKRKHRSGTRPAVGFAYSLTCKGHALADRGSFAQAHECFEEALNSVQGANHEVEASVRGWQSAVFLWQGRWEDALQAAEAAYRIGAQVRSLFSFSMSHAAGAYASWMLERTESSLRAVEDATSWLEPRGVDLFRSLNFGWLADGMATTRRSKEARHFAARALQRARQSDLLGVAMAYRALARMSVEARQFDRARCYLDHAIDIARRRTSPHELAVTQLQRAELLASSDENARARDLLETTMRSFDTMHMRRHLDAASRLYATLSSAAQHNR
jgi:class 3 adenylate cyclase/tetratricopeptide (TPR) repeat protein